MLIEFLTGECPGRAAAQDHIKSVYRDVYGAQLSAFSPLLVVAKRVDGKILCAAGIRTAQNGFFSDTYLGTDFSSALRRAANLDVPAGNIMEVVSLASITPFPVLPMLDRMIGWGRENGMTCGVFTATAPLRRLLRRTGLGYVELAPAKVSMVSNPQDWGHYYDTDPRVCAFNDVLTNPVYLSPRAVPVAAEAS